jgi:hypothetical protein
LHPGEPLLAPYTCAAIQKFKLFGPKVFSLSPSN